MQSPAQKLRSTDEIGSTMAGVKHSVSFGALLKHLNYPCPTASQPK